MHIRGNGEVTRRVELGQLSSSSTVESSPGSSSGLSASDLPTARMFDLLPVDDIQIGILPIRLLKEVC